LFKQTGYRDCRTQVAGLSTVQVANALGVWLRDKAGPPAGPIRVTFESLFSLAFSSHSVED
jgi:hypothetical protein